MYKSEICSALLIRQKLLPLYFHPDPDVSADILRAMYKAGVRMVEYTARGEAALSNFKKLRTLADEMMPGLYLGTGTIKTALKAREFIDAGTDFIVCPIIKSQIADAAKEAGILWIPGCLTPSEIAEAELNGAALIKIFPGSLLGPSYIKAIRDVFPLLKFIPTGGVEPEEKNLKKWFNAGVVAVGMGSKLISEELVQQGKFEELGKECERILEMVKGM